MSEISQATVDRVSHSFEKKDHFSVFADFNRRRDVNFTPEVGNIFFPSSLFFFFFPS